MSRHRTPTALSVTLTAALLMGIAGTAPAQGVSWQTNLAKARETAQQEKAPILVVWTMPQGRGDQELCDALEDKGVQKALARVVPIHFRHDPFGAGETKRPRKAAEPPATVLRPADEDDLGKLLELEGEAAMPEPSLVALLDPEGNGILHHIGRLRPGELVWMLERATREVDPEKTLPEPDRDGVHAPIAVEFAPVEAWNKVGAPLTAERRQELLESLLRNSRRPRRQDVMNSLALMRLADAETQDVIRNLSRGTGGARRGGAGQWIVPIALRTIAAIGPQGWSGFAMEQIDASGQGTREAAMQALEVLAEPTSAGALLRATAKAETLQDRGMLLRAAAAAAPEQRKVQREVLKTFEKARDAELRVHALIACGHLADRDAVLKALRAGLMDAEDDVRIAAAFTAARWRDAGMGLALKDAELAADDGPVKTAMTAAVDAQLGGPLSPFNRFCRTYKVLGLPGQNPLQGLGGGGRGRGGGAGGGSGGGNAGGGGGR